MTAFDASAWVGKTLGRRYRLDHPIGAGGMGAVYAATDLVSGERVAVKLLHDDDPRSLARFAQEARAMMKIAHPNVVRVRAFLEEPPSIVMDHVAGTTLRGQLARTPRLRVEHAVRIATEILEALSAAHDAGIVHRDVKPGNVVLTAENGAVKVVDFGIAKLLEDPDAVRTTLGTVLGTPQYLAPEQIACGPLDGRTDLFAVGVCLFEMLAGERPFKGGGADVAKEILGVEPPRLSAVRAEVTPPLEAVVARALAKTREARFPSARAMIDALRGATTPAKAPSSLTRATVIATGTVLVGAVALAAIAWTRPSAEERAPTTDAGTTDAGNANTSPAPDATVEPEVEDSAAPAASASEPTTPPAPGLVPVRGFKVLSARPSFCHETLPERPGSWRGPRLCLVRETPRCECNGNGSRCAAPWTVADGGWDHKCEPSLYTFGGPGKATGQPCSGYALVNANNQLRSVFENDGELVCDVCPDPKPSLASPGTACSGFNHRGERLEGAWIPR